MRGIKKLSNFFQLSLEMNSGYKSKNIGFYPKSLRPFLRILCVLDDSMYACKKELLVRSLVIIKSSFLLNKIINTARHTSTGLEFDHS